MNPYIKIDNTIVPYAECVRNLGIAMDENLKFEPHVRTKIGQCLGILKTLYKLRTFLKPDIRLLLCNSLDLSHLNYCDIVLYPCLLNKTSASIQRLQNACIRFCLTIPKRSHITPVLIRKNILNISKQVTLKYSCFLHSLIKTKSLLYLFRKLCFTKKQGSLRDRGYQLLLPRLNLAGTRGCFSTPRKKFGMTYRPRCVPLLIFYYQPFAKSVASGCLKSSVCCWLLIGKWIRLCSFLYRRIMIIVSCSVSSYINLVSINNFD
jgi:hypothetical protein